MKWLLSALLFFPLIIIAGYYFYVDKPLPAGIRISRVVVWKGKRKMMVYADNVLIKTYSISLGHTPVGDKVFEGDNRTPEGHYFINAKNPKSICHKNLGISYPDEYHRLQAKKEGKAPGGDIKIHGLPDTWFNWGRLHLLRDWTNGCVGVTNKEIDELYAAVPVGTPIEINP